MITYYLMYGRVHITGNIMKRLLIVPEGWSPKGAIIILEGYSRSMDVTHTLNDLLLGKPEDKRRFYIRGPGFTRLTILKGMRRVRTSSRQCMTPRGWLGTPCAWYSCPCVPPSHDADDASKIKHTASSKKLAHDRVPIIAPVS